jgi:hypothetical protein
MPTEEPKSVVGKFPLRLMPSVRRGAQVFSEKEGVSLNQFINLAVAEKLAHLQHEEWVRSRKQPGKQPASRGLEILERGRKSAPVPGDELPQGYRSRTPPTRRISK